jgi:hypothetical protein
MGLNGVRDGCLQIANKSIACFPCQANSGCNIRWAIDHVRNCGERRADILGDCGVLAAGAVRMATRRKKNRDNRHLPLDDAP